MEKRKTDIRNFLNLLLKCHRFWDSYKQEGVALGQIHKSSVDVDSLSYVMIRQDDWMIACAASDYNECFALWSEAWKEIVELEKPKSRASLKSILDKQEYDELYSEAFDITLFGDHIYEFTRNDLMVAISWLHSQFTKMTDQHINTIKMIDTLNKKK